MSIMPKSILGNLSPLRGFGVWGGPVPGAEAPWLHPVTPSGFLIAQIEKHHPKNLNIELQVS